MRIKFSRSTFFLVCLFTLFTGIFFYPVITRGHVPFPGDLLLAEYQPWRSESFHGYVPGSIPNKAQYFDPLRQMYPWKTVAIESIKRGIIPLWNPHNFSGTPLLANFQSALLFPLNIFYGVFSQPTAWTIIVMLQPFLSLLVVFALARAYGISKPSAIFSALSYAFCLYMATFLEYNILGHYLYLVPLGMLAVERIIRGKADGYILLSSAVAISGVAGHAQLFGGTIGYLMFYALIRLSQSKKRLQIVVLSLLSIGCGIAIAGIQLLPGLELIGLSARSSHSVEFYQNNLLFRPEQLILFLVPDIFGNPATRNYLVSFSYPSKAVYVGVGALLLAGISLLIRKKSQPMKALLFLTVGVALVVMMNPLALLLFHLNIPFLSASSPSNFIFFLSLGICILAGFGLDAFSSLPRKKLLIIVTLGTGILVSVLFFRVSNIPISIKNLLFSSGIFALISGIVVLASIKKIPTIVLASLLIIISAGDLFYFFHKFNPFVPASYLYPNSQVFSWLKDNAGIDRFWGYGSASIEANFATQTQTYAADGYDPLYPKYYGELLQTSNEGKIPEQFTDQTRSDARIVPGYGETDMVDNPYRLKILSLLGVSYILDKPENGSTAKTFPPDQFPAVTTSGDVRVFRNVLATPRVFLTTSFDTYDSPQEFEQKLFAPEFDPKQTILLTERPDIQFDMPLQQKETDVKEYRSTRVEIDTITDAPSLLYLSDTYYEGWKAYVDGLETPIYKANYAFRAVIVPEGNHTVVFSYQPTSFRNGIYLSLVGIVGMLGVYIVARRVPDR